MPSAKYNLSASKTVSSAKTGLQKFYTNKKYWLTGGSNNGNNNKASDTLKNRKNTKNVYENVLPPKHKPEIVIIQTNPAKPPIHEYENVKFNNKCDADSSTSTPYESLNYNDGRGTSLVNNNITVVEIPGDDPKTGQGIKEDRLKIVIENFDKILEEYGTTRPKLQKTKSCSIIESKCILKKSTSDPESDKAKTDQNPTFPNLQEKLEMMKTKSMIDLFVGTKKGAKTEAEKNESQSPKLKICEYIPKSTEMKNSNSKISKAIYPVSKPLIETKPEVKIANVKLKKTNFSTFSKSSEHLNKAFSIHNKEIFIEKSGSIERLPSAANSIIRAKSTFEINQNGEMMSKYKAPSRIPVMSKSNLSRMISPSTPAGLNQLDRKQLSVLRPLSTEQLREPISKINLSAGEHCRRVRAIANELGNSNDNVTLDKCITAGNRILKKVEALNGQANTTIHRKLTYTKKKEDKINVKNVVPSKSLMPLSGSLRNISNLPSASSRNATIPVSISSKNVVNDKTISISSSRNVTSFALLKRQQTGSVKKDEYSIKIKEAIKKPLNKVNSNSKDSVLKNETKKLVDPDIKFDDENKGSDSQQKTVFGLKSVFMIKKQGQKNLDLKNGQENVDTTPFVACTNLNNSDTSSNTFATMILESNLSQLNKDQIYKVETHNGGTLIRNLNKNTIKNNETKLVELNNKNISEFKKVKDYNSDDNFSDDSGNISNENELDYCEEDISIVVPKRKTSSGSDEFLIECTGSLDSVASNSDKTDVKSWTFAKVDKKGTAVADVTRKLDDKKYRSEIFFRPGSLAHLEAQRDSLLTGRIVQLQAHCRGHLARKRLQQRRLQETAVRCIQRNVKAFMVVRDWPWWRLLVRVTPLLNVHRTEEELKKKTEELELLRVKVEKLEQERTTLKHENDKLEAKLSEMTADLAEEHSTSTLAAERLDAETAERIRLERELSEVQTKNKSLQQSSERLEMELLYAKSDMNGVISEEDEDGEPDGGVYKQKYERAIRELEFTRRRLQQQHEDDLEQLVGLKKQLEKKLSDAYEEVEEQRQVVGQWKRKVQKLNAEMSDLRLLLEEQNGRNNLLEKKQRKFDSETQLLQDELRQEKQARERVSREKEVVLAEKYTVESNLADVRLELELKEERLNSLQQEMNDIAYGGKSEEEVATVRKQKQECDRRLHEQEEELDDLAGQVQMLEQAKLRLEMSLEQQRKESRREAQQREDELEEVRGNAQKKVKALEAQLENEHEERTLLLREKHSLERRLAAVAEAGRTEREGEEAQLTRLRRDLRRTKALLRDAQTMLERNKADNPGKAVIRQLRNQLEDLECARAAAVKSKQSIETELSEVQSQLDDANRQRSEAEDRANIANRERTELRIQIDENEEELAEVMKKYRSVVQQLSMDQMALQEQVSLVSDLEAERNSLKEQLAELTTKLESMETMGDPSSSAQAKRLELRVKDLESKLEFEQTTRSRLEVQITRLKETVDKLQTDIANARGKEQLTQDNVRKLQKSLRELRDEHTAACSRESESLQKRKELEKKLESAEAETCAAKADLRLALQRIEDLQAAIQGELEDSGSEHSDSDHDSYSSDESIDTFLANHKLGPSKPDRSSLQLETSPRSSEKAVKMNSVSPSATNKSSFA